MPLIDELEKRFGRRDVAEIEQNLVPEPRVKQMQHGVFRAADVKINAGVVDLSPMSELNQLPLGL